MNLSTSATLADCRRFTEAIHQAGGAVPTTLANILAGHDVLDGQSAPSDPAMAIVKAAVDGEFTVFKRDKMINEAALASMRATYAGDLRRRIEPMLVQAFHEELQSSGADEILDSLRPQFDAAAEHIIASGEPGLIEAWQGLDAHLAVVNAIAAIASQFGCRTGEFVLIEEYANADNFRLDDRALCCADGNVEIESTLFRKPDQGHRTSPFFKVALKLHSVNSMRDRYRQWAAAQWEDQHSGPPTRWIDAAGNLREFEKPTNPYQPKVDA